MNALVLMLMLCLQTQGRQNVWGRGDWSHIFFGRQFNTIMTRKWGGDYRKVASSRPVYYSIFDNFWGAIK